MTKLKIGVYAPALNENKNAAAWALSCADADYRVVIDTGSTDDTKQILQENKVSVYDTLISPWRFDDAYNIAMSLLPADCDVCICLHMDERLDNGWRELLEKSWTPETTRLRYTYIWNWLSPGVPGRIWNGDRIHARRGFRWVGATHEGLCSRVPEVQTSCPELRILHYPEFKNKNGDLPLLQEAVREYPHDARMRAYLGREYMYRGMKEDCIKTYKEFLTMPCWNVERGFAMQNLASVDDENKEFWLKMATMETPNHREPLVELARYYYTKANWGECYKHAVKALEITQHPMDYTCNEDSWSWLPHDLASISAWNLGLRTESLDYASKAVEHNSNDGRLKNNLKIIQDWFDSNVEKSTETVVLVPNLQNTDNDVAVVLNDNEATLDSTEVNE
jgi:glycosyltransferase involved in cell wall biosynthesis